VAVASDGGVYPSAALRADPPRAPCGPFRRGDPPYSAVGLLTANAPFLVKGRFARIAAAVYDQEPESNRPIPARSPTRLSLRSSWHRGASGEQPLHLQATDADCFIRLFCPYLFSRPSPSRSM